MKKSGEHAASGISQLREVIGKLGHNRELFVEQGVVTSESPLQIELDEEVVIDADEIIIAEHLTKHTRQAYLNGSAQLTSIAFDDELSLGDRVIVLADDDTDEYFVIDRAVVY